MKRIAGCLECVYQLQQNFLFLSFFVAGPDGILETGKKNMNTDS